MRARGSGTIDSIAFRRLLPAGARVRQSAALLLLLAATLVGPAQAQTGAQCLSVRLMPLGDSITKGEGEVTDPDLMAGYRQSLYGSLRSAGYNVDFVGSQRNGQAALPRFDADHEGHSGWTTAQVSDTVYSFLQASPADVILLHVGTNDLKPGAELDAIVANVGRILDEIDRASSTTTVVVARIINYRSPSSTVTSFNDRVEALVRGRIAGGDSLVLVDQEGALTYPDDMYQKYHPRQSGYEKMAAAWREALVRVMPHCRDPGRSYTYLSVVARNGR